ncbi:ABC transporter ATP-binding protein [Kytococcus sedentarius]|uniref:ATPase component of various ABC-type transport systems with duplicated ATPase domain n=1 Tax=Kytococcus sedentarius (strain ATCC 14392 / DSM 20547 / JCM 11482 / CCUG 33030 / NBRC 15357 / NCTC 11040 / CCM 314 / 541) TaxID=478801 RepID=C7NJ72_KYTSD|nr:ABC transporter ATP-binding protein [Kytococcus sedentarius]ACV06759.1 ATPase component of various ABC-type transport systems with duplicated ATPase domain [Kytococcus sedentarius DSM 20547]STX14426.1 Putative HMP/thiamine import ATP-binding protein YkoD [Kytococcus sedentarius]
MTDAIVLSAVSFRHADSPRPVLDSIDLTVREGDLALVAGRTGAGKSTLLGLLNGLTPHFSGGTLAGDVRVHGRSTRTHAPRDMADLVGYVGQDPLAGFVTDTVEDEVAYGMEQLGIGPEAMRKRVEETLDVMGIADLRRRVLAELSGGQQQRVAIASVLAAQPRVLVLDEPTSALDPTSAQDVLSAVTTLVHEVGLTVVLAEHRLERVMHAADQMIWVPGDGSVVSGDPRDVLARAEIHPPLSRLARAVGWGSVPLSVREARRRIADEGGPERLLAPTDQGPLDGSVAPAGARATDVASSSRALEAEPPTRPSRRTQALGRRTAAGIRLALAARGIRVEHGDLLAVADVDLDLAAGEVVALMGRNGSGKSSLLWALQGTGKRTAGRVRTGDGSDPSDLSPAEARRHVTLVPQEASSLLWLESVDAELAQADQESGAAPGSGWQVLERLGVPLPGDAHPRDLSEGQRLALVLAIQLTAAPDAVLLDEPTRGLDYAAKDHLGTMLNTLAADGATVVVATHDVEFAAGATTRMLLMADGDLVADGPTAQVATSSPTFAPQVSKVFAPHHVLTTEQLRPAQGTA